MNKSAQLIIKPYKNYFLVWTIWFYLLFIILSIFVILASIFTNSEIEWKLLGISSAIYFLAISSIAIIARLCYRGKLIVTTEEVIKMYGKKIQFKIKKEDIMSICIRKVSPFYKLLVILWVFIGDMCTDLIFFRFHRAEVCVQRFSEIMFAHSLTDKDDKNLQEFAECVTYNQAIKICEKLGLPFNVIKN